MGGKICPSLSSQEMKFDRFKEIPCQVSVENAMIFILLDSKYSSGHNSLSFSFGEQLHITLIYLNICTRATHPPSTSHGIKFYLLPLQFQNVKLVEENFKCKNQALVSSVSDSLFLVSMSLDPRCKSIDICHLSQFYTQHQSHSESV